MKFMLTVEVEITADTLEQAEQIGDEIAYAIESNKRVKNSIQNVLVVSVEELRS